MNMAHVVIPKAVAEVLVTPAAYADERLFEAHRWLRANNPVGLAQPEGIDPFWAVTKHADILAVGRQNDLFHNGYRSTPLVDSATAHSAKKITPATPPLPYPLLP